MSRAVKAECWSCKQYFHIQIESDNYNPATLTIKRSTDCPYCKINCKVEIGKDRHPFGHDWFAKEPPEGTWLEIIPQETILKFVLPTAKE